MLGRLGKGGGVSYLLRYVANCGQHSQYVEEAIVVILALDWPAGVAFWQRFEDLGGDEFGAEEWRCCVGDGCLEGHCKFVESCCGCQIGGDRGGERLDVQVSW